jgi:hypothetical protein
VNGPAQPPNSEEPADPWAGADAWTGAEEGPATPTGEQWRPPEPPEPRRPLLTLVQAVGVFAVVASLGWPLGVLWQWVAPNVPVLIVSDGAIYNDTQPEQFFAGDGWFTVLGVCYGILVTALTWLFSKRLRGPVGMLVLAAGCTVAAVLAWRVGRVIGLDEYTRALHSAAEGTNLSKPNDLRVEELRWWPPALQGVLLVPALGSTLTVTLLAAWSRWSTLWPAPDAPPSPDVAAEQPGA